MGWELRHGRRYLYSTRRVNGKPVKQYLAADDELGFGQLMAQDLARLLRGQAKVRRLARRRRSEYRQRIDGLLADASAANGALRAVTDGLLVLLGYRRHNRGDWRMRRELKGLKAAIDALARTAGPRPMIKYDAPADDAEAVELFAKVRAGDADAQDKLRALIGERKWVDWLGDLGGQATRQLIGKGAGGGPGWGGRIAKEGEATVDEVRGENPRVLQPP